MGPRESRRAPNTRASTGIEVGMATLNVSVTSEFTRTISHLAPSTLSQGPGRDRGRREALPCVSRQNGLTIEEQFSSYRDRLYPLRMAKHSGVSRLRFARFSGYRNTDSRRPGLPLAQKE